jgi:hypothetical protein
MVIIGGHSGFSFSMWIEVEHVYLSAVAFRRRADVAVLMLHETIIGQRNIDQVQIFGQIM